MAPQVSRARAGARTRAGKGVRARALAAAVVLTTGLLAGCSSSGGGGGDDPKPSSSGGGSPGSAGPTPPRDTALPPLPSSLTSQRLGWGRCKATAGAPAPGSDWQCATLKAPLDYAKPDGTTLDLALIRAKARGDDGARIGSLLFNFGGPGGSGVDLLPAFAPQYAKLRERYDLVGFDPRGVSASEGVRCRSDKATQAAESVDLTPDTAAEEAAYLKDAVAFGKGCTKAGELLGHVSTVEAARDLDLMRQTLGDDELHYMGVSYGTELGGIYAHLFPDKVGRLVLDAVVDPTAGRVGQAENQARGFQRALDNYFTSRGKDPKEGSREITALLKRLDAKPLPTAGRRLLNESLATTGIAVTLYSKASWPTLTRALQAAQDGDGTPLLALADSYNDRDPNSGHYGTASHSQRAISCLDDKARPTVAQTKARLAKFRDLSPVFGAYMGWDTAGWCHDWPVPGQWDDPDVRAPGAAPVLVVGNTGDPATPYEGARRMADELGKGVGVELTWKGEGHGAYGSGSSCVDSAVNTYLLEGRIPRDGKVCS
ncbi:alpha/beta hydrolase [Streptomyces sp. SID14478]|uniref:alpha/beta hydrolase n=1 Tax=Streptomyces sp. SID14478 TaxID=2706073 RepID=UPI0013D9E291|nr:alpha/beta hydrolase [Streptomyces sp. SID14478]NEB78969.1 alpha/beta hydrolase [Streptomyces sp. SID14478]